MWSLTGTQLEAQVFFATDLTFFIILLYVPGGGINSGLPKRLCLSFKCFIVTVGCQLLGQQTITIFNCR